MEDDPEPIGDRAWRDHQVSDGVCSPFDELPLILVERFAKSDVRRLGGTSVNSISEDRAA